MATKEINDNQKNNDISHFKGEIRKCPICLPGQLALQRACTLCLGNGFIAKCLNCDGTGKFAGRTAWDGGQNPHTSTCNACGGTGSFPARKPANWDDTHPVDKTEVVEKKETAVT